MLIWAAMEEVHQRTLDGGVRNATPSEYNAKYKKKPRVLRGKIVGKRSRNRHGSYRHVCRCQMTACQCGGYRVM